MHLSLPEQWEEAFTWEFSRSITFFWTIGQHFIHWLWITTLLDVGYYCQHNYWPAHELQLTISWRKLSCGSWQKRFETAENFKTDSKFCKMSATQSLVAELSAQWLGKLRLFESSTILSKKYLVSVFVKNLIQTDTFWKAEMRESKSVLLSKSVSVELRAVTEQQQQQQH